jgi:hypothetical protein
MLSKRAGQGRRGCPRAAMPQCARCLGKLSFQACFMRNPRQQQRAECGASPSISHARAHVARSCARRALLEPEHRALRAACLMSTRSTLTVAPRASSARNAEANKTPERARRIHRTSNADGRYIVVSVWSASRLIVACCLRVSSDPHGTSLFVILRANEIRHAFCLREGVDSENPHSYIQRGRGNSANQHCGWVALGIEEVAAGRRNRFDSGGVRGCEWGCGPFHC